MLPRWLQREAASDNVSHGSWILIGVALAALTVGLIAVPGSPAHTWLSCNAEHIAQISSHGSTVGACSNTTSGGSSGIATNVSETPSFGFAYTSSSGAAGMFALSSNTGIAFLEAPSGTTFSQGTLYDNNLSDPSSLQGSAQWTAYNAQGTEIGSGTLTASPQTVAFPSGTVYIGGTASMPNNTYDCGGTACQLSPSVGYSQVKAGSETFSFPTASSSTYQVGSSGQTPTAANTYQLTP